MTPSAALAHVLVDELARAGVRHVVLCPGSRSAPLAYALLAADRAGALTLHVRVDERSAAFVALGLGAASGTPAAVVTTSGTAVANLHPAVLEAAEAGVPLLVISADRPPELRGTRANQTTTHLPILAGAVRWSHDLGAPEDGEAARRMPSWRTAVDRAVAAATGALGGDPGPVHLNVPLRDPLAPALAEHAGAVGAADAARRPLGSPSEGPPEDLPEELRGRADGAPWTSTPGPANPFARPVRPVGPGDAGESGPLPGGGPTAPEPSRAQPSTAPEPSTDSRPPSGPFLDVPGDEPRTLLVLGDAPAAVAAGALATATARGWPAVGEPFGAGERAALAPHGPLVLHSPALLEEHPPRRIVVVGHLTLTRDVAALVRTPGAQVVVVTDRGVWPDPGHVAATVLLPRLVDTVPTSSTPSPSASPSSVPPPPTTEAEDTDEAFVRAWGAAAARVADLVPRALAEAWPTGAGVADVVLRALPAGATLFVGSSNAARDVDLARGAQGPAVFGNRGLAGIDGNVSTAAGHALARPGTPTYALVGDLTFLHDTNALLVGPGEPRVDLTVVVVDDDGGGIFGTLEYGHADRLAADPAGFERVFGTPTGTRIADLLAAHGVAHEHVDDPDRLAELLARPPRGLRVLTVAVPRDGHRAARDALVRLVADGPGDPARPPS
ncbi:2-succinyl-5-enolpyruvyl-6-hydroxy-3-cyclohexene-1-carboxylate synthase [Agilicoccus flavus]|uniref:2-succinyl-5-enolpyruvyl-6-hydroxy-3- cyclohexene-1-carboxylate synthase n=1 Tax=Agilicoccus flavus TaxID=2775968 RepID=UPI001CF717A7|nr:thiamine pyrophosphate-binding protein [Agilicoccus flavus]